MLVKIRHSALDFLARREHSRVELQRKLSAKGFVVADITRVIENLVTQGLQSDDRFVESYVNMRRKRGFGPVRIKMELNERGIDQDLGESAVKEFDPNWFELAKVARCKKFGENIPDDLRGRTQQMRYLYYKGFTTDHIKGIFK